MPQTENRIPLRFKNRVYLINPDFGLVREIEHELGSAVQLLERLSRQDWKISELVTLTHMMLQAAGETVDYLFLGNQMLRALEQRMAIHGATVLSALVPAEEIPTKAFQNAGYTEKKQSRYFERRVPVQRAVATHLAELGGRILPRDL